jgi:hypothetical protein
MPSKSTLAPPGATLDHRRKILLHCGRLPAQAIVTAQLQHHQAGFMGCKQRRQPCLAACTGVAADRCIDHFVVETFVLEAGLQERHPTLAGIQAKTGADTIANNQHVPAAALWARQYRARPALNHHTRIGFSMGPAFSLRRTSAKWSPARKAT